MIEIEGREFSASEVIEKLTPFVTEERRAKIDRVVSQRTNTIIPVMEDVDDVGNEDAVIRSAESLGYQTVHTIRGGKSKRCSKITQGSHKWVDVNKWEKVEDCISNLKKSGYKIIATHLDENARHIEEFDFSDKCAVVLGNEKNGVSPELLKLADQTCIINTVGLTQSFNISVAGALVLHYIYQQRVSKFGKQGDLTEQELELLRARFYIKSVKRANKILLNHD